MNDNPPFDKYSIKTTNGVEEFLLVPPEQILFHTLAVFK